MNCVLQQGWFSAEASDTLCHGFRAVSVGLHPSNARCLRPTRAVRPAGGASPAACAGAQREVLVRDNHRWGGDCRVGTARPTQKSVTSYANLVVYLLKQINRVL